MDTILPWGNTSWVKLQYQIVSERSAVAIRERVFISDFKGYVIQVEQKDDRRDLLKNVVVEVLDTVGHPYRLILASEGTMKRDPSNSHEKLLLKNGTMQQLGTVKTPNPAHLLQMSFETCDLDLDSEREKIGPLDTQGEGRNMHLKELAIKIEKGKKEKVNTRYWEVEYHKKFSIPFAALAFALIGIPLGLMSKTGSAISFFFAIVLVVVYWIFLTYGEAGGPIGAISPWFSMWLPNVVLSVIGVLLIYYLNHRLHLGIRHWRGLFWFGKNRNEPVSSPVIKGK
jgi:lipopolysaccharide export LptBFGC system permease protein LptF